MSTARLRIVLRALMLIACSLLITLLPASPAGAAPSRSLVAVPDGSTTGLVRITAPVGQENGFGCSGAADGRTAVVTAVGSMNAVGSAFVYTRTGSGWELQEHLPAPPVFPSEYFGVSADVSGDRLLVGTLGSAVYDYERIGAGWSQRGAIAGQGQWGDVACLEGLTAVTHSATGLTVFAHDGSGWTLEATLVATQFPYGGIVAMGPDTIATVLSSGAVRLFQRTESGWMLAGDIPADARALAVNGDTLVIGGQYHTEVYRRSLGAWVFDRTLFQASRSVAVSDDRMWVGSPDETVGGVSWRGAVHEYRRAESGWVEARCLTAPDPSDRGFGRFLSFGRGTLLIGTDGAVTYAMLESHETPEDTSYSEPAPGVLLNDDGSDVASVTAEIASQPAHGRAELSADGSFTYTPDPDFHGVDAFAYRASDGTTVTSPATVTITVTPVNDPPSFSSGGDVVVDEDSGSFESAWATSISPGPNETDQKVGCFTVNSGPSLFSEEPTVSADGTLSFMPAPDAHGTCTVTVTAVDDGGGADPPAPPYWDPCSGEPEPPTPPTPPGLSCTRTFRITVSPVNDPPVSEDDAVETTEGSSAALPRPGVLSNDIDVDGDGLSASLGSPPRSGRVAMASDGSFVYTPYPDFSGTDAFTYRASDGTTWSTLATVTVTVTPVLRPPIAESDGVPTGLVKIEAPQDSADTFFGSSGLGAWGDTLVIGAYPCPSAEHPGGTFVYRRDGSAWPAWTSLAAPSGATTEVIGGFVGVSGNNMLASATGQKVLAFRRSGESWVLLGKVSEVPTVSARVRTMAVDGDTALIGEDPDPLIRVLRFDGVVWAQEATITPPRGFARVALQGDRAAVSSGGLAGVYVYRRSATGWSLETTLPGEADDSVAVYGDTVAFRWAGRGVKVYHCEDGAWAEQAFLRPFGVWYTYGDFGADIALSSDRVWVGAPNTSDTTLQAGVVYEYGLAGSEWVDRKRYEPQDPAAGDLFGLSLSHGGGTLVIGSARHAAYALIEGYDTAEDTPYSRSAPGVLGNDRSSDTLTLTAELVSQPKHGRVELAPDGAFDYVPDAHFNGVDSFSYIASDGTTDSAPATVTIAVPAVNDPPAFVGSGDVAVLEDTDAYEGSWAASISAGPDEDGQSLTWTVENDRPGMFSCEPALRSDGVLAFVPAPHARGSAVVTATLTDDGTEGGPALSVTQTFTVTILPVNHAPQTVEDSMTTAEDVPIVTSAPGLLTNDSDFDGDALTAAPVVPPAHGVLEIELDGSFTYVPDQDFNGVDSFTYQASDGTTQSAPATVTIGVLPVNDAPVALPDTVTCSHGATLAISPVDLLANDTDADGDALRIEIAASPEHGSLSRGSGSSLVYASSSEFGGLDTFTYRAADGAEWSRAATVTVHVESPVPTRFVEASGQDRFATAAEISRLAFPSGAATVVVATGRNWPDALAAGALAGALNAPVILADTNSLPASSSAEIKRLGARDAIIVGGESSVGEGVRRALDRTIGGSITRIWGADRYATAAAVASEAIRAMGPAFSGAVIVAKGNDFPDALAASPLSAGRGWPVYLSRPGAPPDRLLSTLRAQGTRSVLLLGDVRSVSGAVEASCAAVFGSEDVHRLHGAGRYETAGAIASYMLGTASFEIDGPGIATGANFPDALTGGVTQGLSGRLLLLTPPTMLHEATRLFLLTNRDRVHSVVYFGSTSAVTQQARTEISQTLH